MGKSVPKASLGDIAKIVGISKATVSYVLRNRPGPSSVTRERVFAAAKQLGYIPDARVVSWMSQVRDASSKNLLPIAWVDTNWERDSWEKYKFLSPYFEGASGQALKLGYRLEKIWAGQPGMTMRRISQIIYQRGIEGVIITQHVRHFRLNWDKIAAVALEGVLLSPRLHQVTTDYTFNVLLALKMLKRNGYRRIGICLERLVGRGSYNMCQAAAYYFHATIPAREVVPPLFYVSKNLGTNRKEIEERMVEWIRRERPDVIVGHDDGLVRAVRSAGYRVPDEIGVVHIATDNDVSDWAGVNSRRREIGAAAAAKVVELLQNRQFGVPETAQNIGIRGLWHYGSTLLVPKPK